LLHSSVSNFYVYIMASKSRVLYIGVTNDIRNRIWQHQLDELPGFTSKYRVHGLVYFERFQYVRSAIAREKEIKGWLRQKKIALIEAENLPGRTRVKHGTRNRSFAPLRMTVPMVLAAQIKTTVLATE